MAHLYIVASVIIFIVAYLFLNFSLLFFNVTLITFTNPSEACDIDHGGFTKKTIELHSLLHCRSFLVYGCAAEPPIWNMLPSHLKDRNISREQFKSGLKTWLFVQAYS